MIQDRKKLKQEKSSEGENQDDNKHGISSYVDTLSDVKLTEEKRSLDVEEILGLCSEFLNGGTDNTSALLQWIMANLVKNPHIQQKLFMEIKGVIGNEEKMVKEDDLHEMPYLKAVILEGAPSVFAATCSNKGCDSEWAFHTKKWNCEFHDRRYGNGPKSVGTSNVI